MQKLVTGALGGLLLALLLASPSARSALADQSSASSATASDVASSASSAPIQYGIATKRPVFAGACKACPWGVLASVMAAAMKPMGYRFVICWVCWSTYGPREMADRTIPRMPAGPTLDPAYIEPPPHLVPDISATSEVNLLEAWNGTGPYAKDHKPRHNYRVIAALQQPNYLIAAATRKSGITELSQIKERPGPTWMVTETAGPAADALAYYGITEAGLKAKGGGFIDPFAPREIRARADVFMGGGLLVNTPEQRMWYEVSQLHNLVYLQFDQRLLARMAKRPGYVRASIPLALLRGVDRPIPTVMRSVHYIYVRDDAPDSFAYDAAKALDQHQDLLRLYGDPWYYDPKLVAYSPVIPLHPGALKYYRQRGYIH